MSYSNSIRDDVTFRCQGLSRLCHHISLISTLAIPKYHLLFMVHHIYIYINAAASCKRYPPSLPYIIIVQTCGKRWDLPKFVDVFSVNLGFSQSLTWQIHIDVSFLEVESWLQGQLNCFVFFCSFVFLEKNCFLHRSLGVFKMTEGWSPTGSDV